MRPLLRAALPCLLVAAALALPAPAQATTTWTPVPTGTSEEITAIDYRPSRLTFTTSNGKIFAGPSSGPFTVEASYPGVSFTEVEFSPNGALGLATADSGRLYRYAAGAWSPVDLTNSSFAFPSGLCVTTPLVPPAVRAPETPTETLLDAAWADNATAYVVSGVRGRVLKSTDGGLTFSDASRRGDGTCRISDDVTTVVAIPGAPDSLWFARSLRGALLRTHDGLASDISAIIPPPGSEIVNCTDRRVRLALDPVAPQRLSAIAVGCGSHLRWGLTQNGGQSATFVVGDAGILHDVAAAAGVFIAVGEGGLVERTRSTREPVSIRPSGTYATTDWRAVEMLDANRAVIGGTGGRLMLTTTASATSTPPSSSTSGPPPKAKLPTKSPVAGGAIKRSGKNFKMKVRGKLGLPRGVAKKQACRGTVKLTVRKGKRKIATKKAKVKRNCSYKKVIKIKRNKVAGLRKVRLVVAFSGNQVLGKSQQRYQVRVKR